MTTARPGGLPVVFYAGGGLGTIPYTDIIGKVIPQDRRGTFFGGKEALAGPLSVGAALLVRRILRQVDYPGNYALLFALAAAALAVASLGFWLIREPPRRNAPERPPPRRDYRAQLAATAKRLKTLVIVQLLTGFSLMALPFYVVYAREDLGAPPEAVGLNAVLTLPIAILPLLAGVLLQSWSYAALFGPIAGFVALGAVWTRRL